MARLVKLCNMDGEISQEVEVDLGFKYDLLFPVQLKDKDGNVRETLESITFDVKPNRKLSKGWQKVKDDSAREDKMLVDMTGVSSALLDELSLEDAENIGGIIQAFLPKSMLQKETEN